MDGEQAAIGMPTSSTEFPYRMGFFWEVICSFITAPPTGTYQQFTQSTTKVQFANLPMTTCISVAQPAMYSPRVHDHT